VDEFVPRREGAFLAYLRGILLNRIRDLLRRGERRVPTVALPADLPAEGPSPLEEAIGREALEAYEAGLRCLTEEQQMAVILRVELTFTHREIAQALGLPTANAARMLVARGLVRLSEAMGEART
jgi:RNA polymerase sigma-70 factor (ECF subfamily)